MIKSSPTAVSSFCSVCSQNKRRLLRKWESDSRPYKWESDTEGRNFKSQDQPIAGCAPPQLHAKTSSTPIGPVPKKNVVTAVTSPGPPRHLLYWPRRLWLPVALNRSARPTALPSKPDQMPADNRTNLLVAPFAYFILAYRVLVVRLPMRTTSAAVRSNERTKYETRPTTYIYYCTYSRNSEKSAVHWRLERWRSCIETAAVGVKTLMII